MTEEIGRLKQSINKLESDSILESELDSSSVSELDSSSESVNGDATQADLPFLPPHKRNRKIKAGKLTNSKTPVVKRKLPSSGDENNPKKQILNHQTSPRFIGLLDSDKNQLFVGDIVKLEKLSDKGPLAGETFAKVISGNKFSGQVKVGHISKPRTITNRAAGVIRKQN